MKEDREMSCEHTKDKRTEWLNNSLERNEQMAVNRHLADCISCQEEFAADRLIWDGMTKIRVPEPSEAMRNNFYAMLDEFKEAENAAERFSFQSMMESIREFVLPQWTVQVAFSLLLVGLGWVIGNRTSRNKVDATAYQQQIETLAGQVQDMKSAMMLTLLDNPSATERLRAVSYTSEIVQADDRVLEALFATLNNDPNVNVRLVTLEALTQYADNATVREGLVKSLSMQDSPMVQVAMADVMVKLQEKRSVKALKTLLQKEDLNDLVKVKIQQTIKDLS
ncbi:HEAT repeat domain-containing protein [Dyadobacter sp. CY261]|uniref:HEAT repeat domain-containing protein n=1 Tax=Dyadobacter sp. CY261 TaxID=2907203 RepID=UPI001F2D3754|nr:HEAT repeat domain-containing protein [Dyadobacter sp. CY261]MCF0069989.1 HEAT repeat domain-containing protein [Dyadobacter sp. CY261]